MPNAASWREKILRQFPPGSGPLILVADPDSLFSEEKLVLELRSRGFDLLEFEDPILFRYAYEDRFRSASWKDDARGLVVVTKTAATEFSNLPYDLLQIARPLSFSLADLFPNLSYPVVAELEREHLDRLYACYEEYAHERMGDTLSRDFILRHVFDIETVLIRNESTLLHTLLHLHYSGTRLPQSLAEQVIRSLEDNPLFASWALREIVPDNKAFFAFLQERWSLFLEHLDEQTSNHAEGPVPACETRAAYGLRYAGPAEIPFEHEEIRVFIDNLFTEGTLRPVRKPGLNISSTPWVRCGLIEEKQDDSAVRLNKLLENLNDTIPDENAHYAEWISFALKWAELAALAHPCSDQKSAQPAAKRFHELGGRVQAAFTEWTRAHYAGLMNQSPGRPTVLHHVPRFLAREMERSKTGKAALIVVDGLSLDQWVAVREELLAENEKLVMRESALFAWIPTLTSVSRQALFAGKIPYFFKASIKTTSAEESLWRQFWENAHLPKNSIAYRKALGSEKVAECLEGLHPERTKVAGMVIDTVDTIMHGMHLGAAGMHNQIRQWCRRGFLHDLIASLLDDGYQVWLTSDHGNIECRGMGRPADKGLANSRGERARVYASEELRAHAARSQPGTESSGVLAWKPDGLPDEYYPLLATGYGAFAQEGAVMVSHGGISLEEVIVPFVKIERSE